MLRSASSYDLHSRPFFTNNFRVKVGVNIPKGKARYSFTNITIHTNRRQSKLAYVTLSMTELNITSTMLGLVKQKGKRSKRNNKIKESWRPKLVKKSAQGR